MNKVIGKISNTGNAVGTVYVGCTISGPTKLNGTFNGTKWEDGNAYPQQVTINPGETKEVKFYFDKNKLAPGTYRAIIGVWENIEEAEGYPHGIKMVGKIDSAETSFEIKEVGKPEIEIETVSVS